LTLHLFPSRPTKPLQNLFKTVTFSFSRPLPKQKSF
jgi:hypothetical protein